MTSDHHVASRRGLRPAARLAATLTAILGLAGCGGTTTTAPAAPPPPALAAVADPAAVTIPAIGVDAALVGLGLQPDGAMQVPDFGLAGWYAQGPLPGAPGPAVLVGHVDSKSGPDVFYRLRELVAGDQVIVRDAAGAEHAFTVQRVDQVDKDALPVDEIWNATAEPVLRLITCGGSFDRASGHYRDNVIVYAAATAA